MSICVTHIVKPDAGAVVAIHCPVCKRTDFVVNSWAVEPEDGGYYKINMCGIHDARTRFLHDQKGSAKCGMGF